MADQSTPPSILIVEDDQKLSGLLTSYLIEHGFRAASEGRGDRAVERILNEAPDIVILDLMLPGLDGTDVCRMVRDRFDGGILMLTAKRSDVDEVLGLELGADDYVAKPVYPRTLLARIRSVLRRTRRASVDALPVNTLQLTIGALKVAYTPRTVTIGEAAVHLTSTEFEVLWVLAKRAGEAVDRIELYREGLHSEYDGLDRGLDVHISRLRHKLVAAGLEASAIRAVRGVGYVLAIA